MVKKLLVIIFLFPLIIFGQYPEKPVNYVTDETGTLSHQQQEALNRKLHAFEDSTSIQIFVYLAPSLNGREMGDICQEIFHNWHIGSKGKNNGVLIGIFVNDHKFRIHTGYGLEGALPDILTKRIQDEDMRPYFKQNDYYTGIDKGINQLIYYSGHEYKADVAGGMDSSNWVGWLLGFGPNLILLCVLLYLLIAKKKKRSKPVAWTLLLIFGIIFAFVPCIGAVILFFMIGGALGWKGVKGSGSSGSTYYSSSDSSSSWSSSSDSSSGSSFDGGGGGDSGGGGSNSDW